MLTVPARCGHHVTAVGAPGSMVRRAVEVRTCGLPRCESGLPARFTDQECTAYVWLIHRGFMGWVVDMADKSVRVPKGTSSVTFESLLTAARHFGWEG